MARKNREAVLKRQRERKKAEKAALKREQRAQRQPDAPSDGSRVASEDDLEGYGLARGPTEETGRD